MARTIQIGEGRVMKEVTNLSSRDDLRSMMLGDVIIIDDGHLLAEVFYTSAQPKTFQMAYYDFISRGEEKDTIMRRRVWESSTFFEGDGIMGIRYRQSQFSKVSKDLALNYDEMDKMLWGAGL